MVTADQLRSLREAATDYLDAQCLKADFAAMRQSMQPFWLAETDMRRIFKWKLTSQYDRVAYLLNRNSPDSYIAVTRACFEFRNDDANLEAVVRLGILTALSGVGVPVASAVLALVDPARYCVVDFRGWRAVYDKMRSSFTVPDYIKYRGSVAKLADELGWGVQETDLAIWELDKRRHAGEPAIIGVPVAQ